LDTKDFDLIASAIGPDIGAAREALRAHYVDGLTKAKAAAQAGVSRATVTEYVNKWERQLATLSDVNWKSVKAHSTQSKNS
jgi:transposase